MLLAITQHALLDQGLSHLGGHRPAQCVGRDDYARILALGSTSGPGRMNGLCIVAVTHIEADRCDVPLNASNGRRHIALRKVLHGVQQNGILLAPNIVHDGMLKTVGQGVTERRARFRRPELAFVADKHRRLSVGVVRLEVGETLELGTLRFESRRAAVHGCFKE